jgi:hypothetical protein
MIVLERESELAEKERPNNNAENVKPKNPATREVNRYQRMTDPAKELARPLLASEDIAGLRATKIKIGTKVITTSIMVLIKEDTGEKNSENIPPRNIPEIKENRRNKYWGILDCILLHIFNNSDTRSIKVLLKEPRFSLISPNFLNL